MSSEYFSNGHTESAFPPNHTRCRWMRSVVTYTVLGNNGSHTAQPTQPSHGRTFITARLMASGSAARNRFHTNARNSGRSVRS